MGQTRPVSRKHSFMPGYGGSIQHEYNQIAMTFGKAARVSHTTASNNKMNPRKALDPRETFTANDFYARLPDPRRKTNSKNRSNLDLGDPRAQTFETMNMSCYRTRELPNPRAPLVEGFEDMSMEERDRIYRRALERTTITGVRKLESDIRMKIDQRTSGGPFALRKAFKYFDRDGSGDIDPDEFFAAMDWFGLQFTEDAVLALFGLYDDDRGGSLGYYEFVDNIISSDKNKQAQMAGTARINEMLAGTQEPSLSSTLMKTAPGAIDEGLARKCFEMCDNNGSGKIELVELEGMFKQLGLSTDSDVLNTAFVALDKNFDEEICFEEFWEWWQRTVPRRAVQRGGIGEQGRKSHASLEKERTEEQERNAEKMYQIQQQQQNPVQHGRSNQNSRTSLRAPSQGGFQSTGGLPARGDGDVLAMSPNQNKGGHQWRGPTPHQEC